MRGAPLGVRFRFIAALDDPCWLWLRFDGARVLTWTPPPVGRTHARAAAGLLL